jgi:adenylate kinase family enzyme
MIRSHEPSGWRRSTCTRTPVLSAERVEVSARSSNQTRADDTPQAVQARLWDYHAKTRPVLEMFGAKDVVVAVDAAGPVAQVQAAIRDQLGVETSSA